MHAESQTFDIVRLLFSAVDHHTTRTTEIPQEEEEEEEEEEIRDDKNLCQMPVV